MNETKSSHGLVPARVELTGLTEIRVHGVGGTRPQDLLGDRARQGSHSLAVPGGWREFFI